MPNYMKGLKYVYFFISAFTIVSCSKKTDSGGGSPVPVVITAPPDFGFKVVGYFPYYRDPATVPDVKFRMTNVVNYAFFTIQPSNSLLLNNAAVFNSVITKSKANNSKIMMAINGAHTDFKNMAATPTGRNNFIKEVMNYVRQYQLHGVDMDWEFPTTSDGTDISFTALMKELSDSCHRDGKYYLTAAITPGKYAGGQRDAIKTELFGYCDWFNVMVYDDFSTTVPYKQHSDMGLANLSVNYWINTRGMPKSKYVMGLPAYGRPSGITQTGTVLTYSGILLQGGNPLSDSALVTAGGFTNYTIYYNGIKTVKNKTMLAYQQGNGVMLWEKGQDVHDGNSLLKAVCDTLGRPY
jgi:GH18 family chitinase